MVIKIFSVAMALLLPSTAAIAGLFKDQTLQVGELTRTYDLYVPDRRGDDPRPLVVLLHGHMGDADVMTGGNRKAAPYKVWLEIAAREGLVVAVPDGAVGSDGYRGWNDCRGDAQTNPKTNDVAFIDRLIDAVAARTAVDRRRIYVHGTSNGGNMVYRLAQELPERFAAFAAVVAAMPAHNTCRQATQAVSLLIMNGTDDPILPYRGGAVGRRARDKEARGTVLSTADTLNYWLARDGITTGPAVTNLPDTDTRDGGTVHVERYTGGKAGSEVVLYEVRGGGHTEPSRSERYRRLYRLIVGAQNGDIEMAEEVWKFFSAHARRDPVLDGNAATH